MSTGQRCTPSCTQCGARLDRVDHYGIEHLILDQDIYREVNAIEGLASEIDLRCACCGASLDQGARVFFYKRWWKLLAYRLGE